MTICRQSGSSEPVQRLSVPIGIGDGHSALNPSAVQLDVVQRSPCSRPTCEVDRLRHRPLLLTIVFRLFSMKPLVEMVDPG